jgi:hypothetical protein
LKVLTLLRLSDEFRNGLGSATEAFHQAITPEAVSYLRGRGIPTEAIIEYKLGTVVAGDVSGYDDYDGMISIPYLTSRGGVCAIKVRQDHDCPPEHDHAKYLQAAGEARLYNTTALDWADRLGYVGICEGELDALIATYCCKIPTVGIPGVDTWPKRPEWALMFRGYKRVLIFKDNDPINPQTGKRPGSVLARRIAHDIDTAEIIEVPAKDLTLAYVSYGAAAIRDAAKV